MEVAEHGRVLVVGAAEALLDVGELVADPFLFGLEQVERDRFGVVGLEQLGAILDFQGRESRFRKPREPAPILAQIAVENSEGRASS